MKHIEIKWLDSHSWSSGWMKLSEALDKIKDIKPIHSSGYVFKEDDDYVYIAQNQNGDNISHLFAIPKKSIIEMT